MGDLARALVDLGAAAERRRDARSQLRKAVPIIVEEMLRHLRTGDEFTIMDRETDHGYDEPIATYRVERVAWEGTAVDRPDESIFFPHEHPTGAATLVRWEGNSRDDVTSGHPGVALYDPRQPWTKDGRSFEPIKKRRIWIRDELDEKEFLLKLRWANDDELVLFASEADEVVAGFASRFTLDAGRMKDALDAVARLTLR